MKSPAEFPQDFFVKNFYNIQKTLYFDNSICYNNIDILYSGDFIETSRKISRKNEKRP